MSNEIFFATDIIVILLELCCASGNGFIIYLFLRHKVLRSNKNLRLVAYLAASDLMVAVTESPYTWYLFLNWNSVLLDYNPFWIMNLAVPLLIQLKLSLVLTIMIAADRNIALFWPAVYRKVEHILFANFSLFLAVSVATFDVILMFCIVPQARTPGCASIGCFINENFRAYWGNSNMVLGILVISFTLAIFVGIRKVERSRVRISSREEKRFANANKTIAGILVSSLICITIPSAFVGVVELIGFSVFRLLGPFYLLGLLLSGVCNSVIFICLNDDARRIVLKKSSTSIIMVATNTPSKFLH